MWQWKRYLLLRNRLRQLWALSHPQICSQQASDMETWWYSSSPSPKAQKPEKLMLEVSVWERKKPGDPAQRSGRQNSPLTQPFCSIQISLSPHWEDAFALLSTQMQCISSRRSLKTLQNNVGPLAWAPHDPVRSTHRMNHDTLVTSYIRMVPLTLLMN